MYGATHKVPRSVFPETKILFNFNDSHNEIDWPWGWLNVISIKVHGKSTTYLTCPIKQLYLDYKRNLFTKQLLPNASLLNEFDLPKRPN